MATALSMRGGPQQNGFDMLNLDVRENDREVVVFADLPGVNKSDIEVFVDDGVLTIRAEGSILKHEKASFHIADRRFRLFGLMRLSCSVDVDRIQTNFDDGVLIVTLPKRSN